MELTLFDAPIGRPKLVTRSMPIGQRRNVAQGLHPLGMDFADNDETCGTCRHIIKSRYKKCRLAHNTAGPATDIRMFWPACQLWRGRT